MSKFKIGDKIRVVNDFDTWLYGDTDKNTVFTVVEDNGANDYFLCPFSLQADIGIVNSWAADFELVEEPKTVVVINKDSVTTKGTGTFVLGEQVSEYLITKDKELGVFRPNLDDRKIGKVRVELVDDGFPLALREIAKIMSWAQTAKGYEDHDWQNLPNAEIALAAAASRHRTDHIRQRVVDGLAIDQCVDSESKLLHKAHEAFGVLAQLELMLRGKFD